MPNELAVLQRSRRRHHAVDPFRVEEGLIDIWRAIVPLPLHVQVVAALKRDRATCADFIGAGGDG